MSIAVNTAALSKNWKRYQIMHKDRRVASIRENGTCTVYRPSFMPFNSYLEKASENDVDARVNNLNNFYYWCASRVLTLDRKYAKEIMNTIGAKQTVTDKDRAAVSLSYHALSLTDVYWVKQDGEKLVFADICLYNHSLSGAFADVSLSGRQLTVENSELITRGDVAGDVSTQGVSAKAWIRENGTFFLLKDGDRRDVDAEILASKIIDCFDVKHVSYSSSKFDNQHVSKSEIITSQDYSIVPIEYIEIYCLNNDLDKMAFILKEDAYSYHMMNIIDYLIGNTDRHWGNWGFLIDNKNNKPCGLYPLMDFNKAFTAYDVIDGGPCQTSAAPMSQKDAALEGVRKVGLNQTHEVLEDWFQNKKQAQMFFARLDVLKGAGVTK